MPMYVKDFIVNLFLLLLIIQLSHFGYQRVQLKEKSERILLAFALSISLIIALSYIYPPDFDRTVDFRLLPLILGCLYGGFTTGSMLIFVTYTYTLIWGPYGAVESFLLLFPPLLTCSIIGHFFYDWALKKKLLVSSSLAGFFSIYYFFIFEVIYHEGLITHHKWWIVFIIHIVGTTIITNAIEALRKNRIVKKQMIDIEKMEIVSQLAASISHEVRNPLTSTKGFLQLLQADETLLPEKKQEFLKIALDELNRAEGIIRDYLTFAKPSVHSISIINGQEELAQVIDIITPLAHMNSIEVSFQSQPFYIKGEKTLFQQCFVNLTKNAIEAMPDGGMLTISSVLIGSTVDITIMDQGIGMSAEQIARLGEPYYTTKGAHGTGLGMMVVYSIIHSMSGSIKVNSKLGIGTSFTISLPQAIIG